MQGNDQGIRNAWYRWSGTLTPPETTLAGQERQFGYSGVLLLVSPLLSGVGFCGEILILHFTSTVAEAALGGKVKMTALSQLVLAGFLAPVGALHGRMQARN
jgi:hypothetical protein